jgi:O-antigen/teichoic acid export membrane protein
VSLVRRNIAANLAATAIAIVAAIAAVPLLVRGMGLGGFGIVGLHATLAGLLAALDLGLAPSVGRELARRAAVGESAGSYLATAAALVWSIAGAIAGVALLAGGAIAERWLADETDLRGAVVLIGLAIAAQWPATCYRAALLGLQRQTTAATLSATFATLRTLGAAALVLAADLGPIGYLWIQIGLGIAETLATRAALRAVLPEADRGGAVRWSSLRGTLRFTAGMAIAGSLGLVAAQTDRIVLARLVTLEAFGIYSIAAALASGIFRAAASVSTAVTPRLTELIARAEPWNIAAFWGAVRAATHAMAMLALPIGVAIGFFPTEALRAWGQPPEAIEAAAASASLLALGAAINTLVHPVYALVIARGAAVTAVVFQAVGLAILAPTVAVAASRSGLVGAATAWLVLDAALLAAIAPAVLRRLAPGHAIGWVLRDALAPLAAALAVGLLLRLAIPVAEGRGASLASLAGVWAATTLVVALATPLGSGWIARTLRRAGGLR